MEYEFQEEVESEKKNTDSNASVEHKIKKKEPIAVSLGTTELETKDCENQFEGRIDLDNDDFCRWIFGDEFMEEVERMNERNALIYGT